jgi:hypothetical protein
MSTRARRYVLESGALPVLLTLLSAGEQSKDELMLNTTEHNAACVLWNVSRSGELRKRCVC